MKKLSKLLLVLLVSVSLVGCGGSSENEDVIKIGVTQFAEHPALDLAYDGFVAALEENGYKDGENISIDYQVAAGDSSNCETIANKFVNDGVNLIYAIATPTAQAAASKTSDTPIVISAVTDPATSGLVDSNEAPGGNITGTSDLTPINEQLDLLVQLLPKTKTVGVMYCSAEDNSIFQANIAKEKLDALGLSYKEYTVTDSSTIQQVAESMVGNVDAVYIPTDNLLAEYMTSVEQVCTANGLPIIVGEEGMCTNGGVATYGLNYYNIGYNAGLQAVKILKGESKPADMPIEYLKAEDCELIINKSIIDQLGLTIPQDLLDSARIIGE